MKIKATAGEGRFFAVNMAFSFDDWLPTYEELDVHEVGMTASPLRAGALYFGKYCDNQCKVSSRGARIWGVMLMGDRHLADKPTR